MGKSGVIRSSREFQDVLKNLSKEHNLSQIAITAAIAKELKKKNLFDLKKKGQADNIALILVAVFVMAVMIIPVFWIIDTFNTEAQSLDEFQNNTAGSILQDQTDKFPPVFDGLVLFVLVALVLALIGSAFLVDAQPFFFVISFVIFIMVLGLAAILANVFDELATAGPFGGISAEFPITTFVFQNYVLIFTVIGFASFIVLYAKLR